MKTSMEPQNLRIVEGQGQIPLTAVEGQGQIFRSWVVYGLIDPRSEEMFWVGAGRNRSWKYHALKLFSDGKQRRIREIEAAGLKAEPELIKMCRTRREAMAIKAEFCAQLGQAFRGARRPWRKGRRARYLAKHAGTLAPDHAV